MVIFQQAPHSAWPALRRKTLKFSLEITPCASARACTATWQASLGWAFWRTWTGFMVI